jgi:DNA-binding PadR family transcriptional regulator
MFNDGSQGPRFAYASGPFWRGGGGDEEWQPWARGGHGHHGHHGHEEHHGHEPWPSDGMPFGPGMLRHFARRFGFGPGGFGPGPGGFGPGGPRMFGRGDLKYALLDLLQERPKHGYEMMKELEDRSGGFYSPSAGAIYPTLQLLEDRGWVTTEAVEGKKVYAITDAGREALNEFRERSGGPWGGPGGPWGHHRHEHGGPFGREARPELRALRDEVGQVVRLMRAAVLASGGDPQRLARVRAIVTRTRTDLEAYLGQATSSGEGAPGDESGAGATGPVEQV